MSEEEETVEVTRGLSIHTRLFEKVKREDQGIPSKTKSSFL